MSGRRGPVRRRNVAAGALVVLAAVTGIVMLTETLRHPLPEPGRVVEEEEPSGDPRVVITCPAGPDVIEGETRSSIGPITPVAVTSSMLHDCPRSYDGAVVSFRGEVVGAVLRREDGAWLKLNDDVYAGVQGALPAHRDYRGGNDGVGVFVSHEVADRIVTIGGPHYRGDILAVTGIFRRVDPTTQEIAVIRAAAGDVIEVGRPFEDVRLPDREIATGLLAIVALVLVARERIATHRDRRG